MTVENEQAGKTNGPSPIILSPWLVALGALVLYGFTLNHWVRFNSLPFAAAFTGWDWHPGPLAWRSEGQYPLFLILTLPLKLLPLALRPLGLNLFAAVCAALTLAVLARSVRLLSHDRTKEQRLREGGDFALLSVRAAFLPAALAVLMLAGELTFWENATVGTMETLDLLVFAFLIQCLLEFRLSQNERWFNAFAVVYGAGVANNWALIGFFPAFLMMTIWIKRAGFFNWRFVLRVIGWGVLGLLFYGIIPLKGMMAGDGGFWELLHLKLAEQHLLLTRFPRYIALISGVPTLVPLLFAAIKWPSFEGELSAGAHDITRALFRVLHLIFLAVGLLMFFDVKLSPSPRYRFGVGIDGAPYPSFLTFYYLAAVSVGYFSGYVLLVFGKDVAYKWGRATGLLRIINLGMVGLLWVTALGLPIWLFSVNYGRLAEANSPAVSQFGMELAKSLPNRPAVVLADDEYRLALAMGSVERLGLPQQYIFVESGSLLHREYLSYLAHRFPSFRKEITNTAVLPKELSSVQMGEFLKYLSMDLPVYYLHPSFGTYFEWVCMVPRGLGGDIHPYPSNELETLVLTRPGIATNQLFFRNLKKEALDPLLDQLKERNANPETAPIYNSDAVKVGAYYSQALDYWGAELQTYAAVHKESNYLADAGDQFAVAIALNPDNLVAPVNQQYNLFLRGLPHPPPPHDATDLANRISSWETAYNDWGPVEVPDLYIQVGRSFSRNRNLLQAAHMFQRSLDLAPENPVAELDLAKTYIDLGANERGLRLIESIKQHFTGSPVELLRVEAFAHFKKHDFAATDRLLQEAYAKVREDEALAGFIAECYREMGLSVEAENKSDPAKESLATPWFEKSRRALEEQLRLMNKPTGISSYNSVDLPVVTLRLAEIQMMLKQFKTAITNLTTLVSQYKDDPLPRLNRAICELQISNWPAAKADYQAVENIHPTLVYLVPTYYGLAQIAREETNRTSEVRYCESYLNYAPTNTAEFTNVTLQLRKAQGH
jgi:tetratricopeptide (TPR) repeat protein